MQAMRSVMNTAEEKAPHPTEKSHLMQIAGRAAWVPSILARVSARHAMDNQTVGRIEFATCLVMAPCSASAWRR